MNRETLVRQIFAKKSYLCVGLDTDLSKIPSHLRHEQDPIFEFNKQIIDATHDLAVAYKPNLAFYEAEGLKGWESLAKTEAYLPTDTFKIADAKRGDIGNTSAMYAKAFFEQMSFDAVTVSPYMGEDSVKPFMTYADKWIIVLALTSNGGSLDFQHIPQQQTGEKLYETVIRKTKQWGKNDQLMYVVGATKADYMQEIRQLAPEHFFLVPGVGAQGGSLQDVSLAGLNRTCGLLVNASRSIIYASDGKDFAKAARKEAMLMQQEMEKYLEQVR